MRIVYLSLNVSVGYLFYLICFCFVAALNVHFESQPLPTNVAWYMHHLPTWFLKLGTVYAQIVEQLLPFLFFFPLRSVRIVGFFHQAFLQICILLSGNYNFFNLLTVALCFSLLDDKFFVSRKKGNVNIFKKRYDEYLFNVLRTVMSSLIADQTSRRWTILNVVVNILVHGLVIYLAIVYYSLKLNPNWTIDSEIAFSKADFDRMLREAVPASIYIGCVSLHWTSLRAIFNCFNNNQNKITNLLITLFYISTAFFLFGVSLVGT